MTKLNSSFMIGNVEIPHRTVLAPMAGVTNSAFRTIAKEFGAGLVVMEMISEKGLLYNNEKTLHMLHIDENEHPMSIQLFGGDAEGLKRAADFIQTNTKADIVDINMGCPVNKVVKNEAGAKWLKDPDKIYHIVKEVTSVLDIPLTVKMRTGWSDSDLAVENALAAESAGVSALGHLLWQRHLRALCRNAVRQAQAGPQGQPQKDCGRSHRRSAGWCHRHDGF